MAVGPIGKDDLDKSLPHLINASRREFFSRDWLLQEEGTWSPNVTAGKATDALGTYQRVGDVVTMTARVYVKHKADAKGIEVTGWPFLVDGEAKSQVTETTLPVGFFGRIRSQRIYWLQAVKSGKVQS